MWLQKEYRKGQFTELMTLIALSEEKVVITIYKNTWVFRGQNHLELKMMGNCFMK